MPRQVPLAAVMPAGTLAGCRAADPLDLRKRQVGARLPEAGRRAAAAGAAAARAEHRRTAAPCAQEGRPRRRLRRPAFARAGTSGARRRTGQRGRDAGHRRPRLIGRSCGARSGRARGAAGRPGFAAAHVGRERVERPELRLRRLPAAGRGAAKPAHPGTGSRWRCKRPDPAVHRNAVSQRRAVGRAVEGVAAGHPPGGRQRPDFAAGGGPQPAGRRLARAGRAGRRTTRRPCSRSAVERVPRALQGVAGVPEVPQRNAGSARSARMAPSPMAAPNFLASRSATFSRRV